MNRLLSFVFSLILCTVAATAQNGLEINKIFGQSLSQQRGVTENLMRGGPIKEYGLTLFRSISLDDSAMDLAPAIEAAVLKDSRLSGELEEQRKDGVLYYSFFPLPQLKKGHNRYVFYLNRTLIGESGVVLIYMEGTATLPQIRKMLK